MSEFTTSAAFFERMYRKNPDPWNFAGSDYECARYKATIAALGDERYKRAFEPGCSVGELTALLAERCDRIDAIDISPTAIATATLRCDGLQNVALSVGSLPHHIPGGTYDLIVFSEIGYYFHGTALKELGQTLVARLLRGGSLLAVHWLGTSKDHVLTGDQVHQIVGELSGLTLKISERYESFRLDRWVRV